MSAPAILATPRPTKLDKRRIGTSTTVEQRVIHMIRVRRHVGALERSVDLVVVIAYPTV